MKKKVFSLLLALVMVFAMGTTAFAAQEGEKDGGSITIDNAVSGQTYNIYQILYLESYSTDADGNATGAYAYKANSAWESWLKTQTNYVSIDAQGYVTWVSGASAADFAKAAQAEATKQGSTITADDTATASSTTVTFSNLKLGYYLVDSTLGTLCSLDTTNPTVTIKEKNVAPTNAKKVQEDSKVNEEGNGWGDKNDADIGQTVNFQSTITAQAGAQNYVFHDKMDSGLTFGSVTGITLNGTAVDNTDSKAYTVKTTDLGEGDTCTFHVVFTQVFCDTLKANDKIVISYTATLNENATVGNAGNKNESYLKYGENSDLTTVSSETTTCTWDVDVFKYTKDGETEKPLAGAKFTLSKSSDGTDPIALVNGGNNVYRVATADDTNTVTEITTDTTGKFTIKGLDSDTYYLTETAAPAGYNKLAGAITIVISSTGEVTVDNGTTSVNEVKVLNQSGSELPSTGGMGTTIFYIVGGILVLGAVVLLVTKKRMNGEK